MDKSFKRGYSKTLSTKISRYPKKNRNFTASSGTKSGRKRRNDKTEKIQKKADLFYEMRAGFQYELEAKDNILTMGAEDYMLSYKTKKIVSEKKRLKKEPFMK